LHCVRCLAKVRFGRAFVRPSGTEDIVRVYAEGGTQEEADAVAKAVARHVYDHANRVVDVLR
jgi:phosphoacetylglucosamine mutase